MRDVGKDKSDKTKIPLQRLNGFLKRHFDILTVLSNIFIGIGTVGLSLLGVYTDFMAYSTAIFWGVWLGILFLIGKTLDGQLEDISSKTDEEGKQE